MNTEQEKAYAVPRSELLEILEIQDKKIAVLKKVLGAVEAHWRAGSFSRDSELWDQMTEALSL